MAFNAPNQSGNAAQAAQTTQVHAKKSILALGRTMGAPMARISHGETVSKITETLTALAKEVASPMWDSTKIIPMDNQSSNLQLSTIQICGIGAKRVGVFTLIVDGTGAPRSPKVLKAAGGRDVEVPRVAGDLYCDAMWQTIEASLRNNLGDALIEDAGAAVIPANFDVEDQTSLRVLLHCATNAIDNLFKIYADPAEIQYFNAAEYAGADYVARTVFQPGVGADAVGNPVRRNFQITMTARDRAAASDVSRDTVTLSDVGGYVGLTYIGKSDTLDHLNRPMFGEQQYLPTVNISTTLLTQDIMTPELQLVALASAFPLSQNGAWMNAYRPRYGADQSKNLSRLDGIGKELGLVVDTTDPQFDPFVFLRTYAYQQPVYVLHVDQVGPMSWLLQVLADAGNNVPEATNAIFNSMNRVTNGNFSQLYKGTQPAFVTMEDVVILGWYVDTDGVRQDLRDIDPLAILNLQGGTDTSLALEFEQTFNPASAPLEERIDARVRILKTVTADQMRIEGYAKPVIIAGEVLEALWTGLQNAGLVIRKEGPQDAAQAPIRENLGMLRYAVNPLAQHRAQTAVQGQWNMHMRTHYTR